MWVTCIPTLFGSAGLPVHMHLQWEMWVLGLYVYLYSSTQSLIHIPARRHLTRSHSALEILLLVAPMYDRLTNQLECRLCTVFCPGLCEGHDADKSASSGVRLGFHCCCVVKVSPVLSQIFMVHLYLFSSISFLLMVILNRCHHSYFPLPTQDSYGYPSLIYTCWYTLIPTVSTGVTQAIYQERKS